MRKIDTIDGLEALYGPAASRSLTKVMPHITPLYRRWIEASRFCVLTSVGPGGTDGSPRGDDGPVAEVADERTILMPDWRGNNRLDTLRNIVADGRLSLMFMVPGSTNVVRVNGTAYLTDDAEARARFAKGDAQPTTVIVTGVAEVYFQCAKAVMRAGLWDRDDAHLVPSAGDFVKEAASGDFDARAYDADYPAYAAERMW
ncbi:pyridoxamine 5'-phosphate oxidase family protein [Roseivivax sediminis]|uniref:Pyridoxamine 5'-phosphate oxidase N-terminal domain-containing protein n=1 Tax=Roseivivax sediminis TaxID=936889 RepID=A0A1I1ZI53_9RHOB|nr:pyridoxamine 5'-phosphate oxidase family protein [Roseivivax sediminis]SFE31524.1 hypothetical protein SAMN04515678_108156 [Roseivivax sediminis]